jgi:hypothetical protein
MTRRAIWLFSVRWARQGERMTFCQRFPEASQFSSLPE